VFKEKMTDIHPIELKGNWQRGYALDKHSISSTYLGEDQFGHPRFDTKRSEIGELVVQLKYKNNKSVIGDITNTVAAFLKGQWKIVADLDYIVPVPPSNLNRTFQPVIAIADELSKTLMVPICVDTLVKIRKTTELKNTEDDIERAAILKGAFRINGDCLKGKNILLFDDLYDSGETLREISEVLYNEGDVSKIYVLTLTKTRA
jgi:competence protein ComFC